MKKTAKKTVKKVGASERKPSVKHTHSHIDPKSVKKGGKGRGHGKVDVMQGVSIVEYPGERGKGRVFKGIKTVDSRG